MSILTEAPAPPAAAALPASNSKALAARNHALLSFRDNALLLAYRISGNLADAEDILQNAYVRAVRAPADAVPSYHQGAGLRNWFLKLTANAAKDWCRSEHRRRDRERIVAMEHAQQAAPAASEDCEHAELKRQLNLEIARLDEKLRAPICLHYEQGLTYEEASEILDVPAASLRVNASRGVQLLRERLDRPPQPVSAELLTAVLALGSALTASQALAASIDQIVAPVPAAAAAPAAKLASGVKVFTPAAGEGMTLLVKVLIAAIVLLAISNAVVVWMFINERQTRTAAEKERAKLAAEREELTVIPAAPPIEAPAKEVAAFEQTLSVPPAALKPGEEIFPLPGANAPWVGHVPVLEPGTDYVLPAEVEAPWQNAIDLAQHFRGDADVVAGNWTRKDGGLYQTPAQFSRISLNCIPPEEYDFRIDFTRLGGETETMQMLPIDGATAAWHIESWRSHYWGPLKDNPNVAEAKHLANGRRHTSIIEVRKDTLSAWLDGELILSIRRAGAMVDAESYWRLPDQRMLGIGGKATRTHFHRVALREVTGKAQMVGNDPFAAVLAEKYWTGARDLLPKTISPPSQIAGTWATRPDGSLICTGQFARYQFDYAPPEEYDMRIGFTRTVGERDIVQILSAAGKQFSWKIGAALVTTLDTIGGRTWSENPVALRTPDLIRNGVRHTSVFCVRKGEVRAYVDGRLMLAWKTDFSNLSMETAWKLRAKDALGVGSLDNAMIFSKIQVKELSGPGRKATVEDDAANGAF